MNIKRIIVGPLEVNAYIVYTETVGEKEGFIIDPGGDATRLLDFLKAENIVLRAILNTHGHGDHIGAVEAIRKATGAKFYLHEGDASMVIDAGKNLSMYIGNHVTTAPPDVILQGGEDLTVAGLDVKVIHTPGHTPGGVCYLVGEDLFSGDSLFWQSIGRTDFPDSSYNDLVTSLKERVLPLPEKTVVYPGHGDKTTIANEKEYNPYLRNHPFA